MTDGWRGSIQQFLRRAADALDKTPPKRWTAKGQRTGIAVVLAVFGTAATCLLIAIALSRNVGLHPSCADAACFQSMWQGRWAMSSLLVSVITFGLVVLGFRQAQENQRHEFSSYVRTAIKSPVFKPTGVKFRGLVDNYGRTPAMNLIGTATVRVQSLDGLHEQLGRRFEIMELHPGRPKDVTEGLKFDFSSKLMTDMVHRPGIVSLSFDGHYKTVFGKVVPFKDSAGFLVHGMTASGELSAKPVLEGFQDPSFLKHILPTKTGVA